MRQPSSPPDALEIFRQRIQSGRGMLPVGPTEYAGQYLHWDKLRFLPPVDELNIQETWAAMKMARLHSATVTPFKDMNGRYFSYVRTDYTDRICHELDQLAGGRLSIEAPILNADNRNRYLVRSLIEESFSSSYLEGAVTTRSAAKELIRLNRTPRNKSEQMVMNNYMAMFRIREMLDVPLSKELILELHSIVTKETLDKPEKSGCFRTDDDKVMVFDDTTGEPLHIPPPAEELPGRIDELCRFVNEDGQKFVHPIFKAIIVHFMIGYDHPFYDGNGRTARALFYWCMLKNRYWLTEYISISSEITKAPSKYYRSFLETETDSSDLTYFILYNLKILNRAFDSLQLYIKSKVDEFKNVKSLLKKLTGREYNSRQLALIEHACTHPGTLYQIEGHQKAHNVHYLTARQDLEELTTQDILTKVKQGRKNYYIAGHEIREMLELKLSLEDFQWPENEEQLQFMLDEPENTTE